MNDRCVDASLIVKLALEDEAHSATARRLVRESAAAGIRLIAPPHLHSRDRQCDPQVCPCR